VQIGYYKLYIVQIEFLQLNFAIELVSGQPSSVTIFAFPFPFLEPKARQQLPA
jgi:hypothetical protein